MWHGSWVTECMRVLRIKLFLNPPLAKKRFHPCRFCNALRGHFMPGKHHDFNGSPFSFSGPCRRYART